MQTAVVTGGTGCVGRNLINELLWRGWRVVVLHRASSQISRLAGLGVDLRACDLHSWESVRDAMPYDADCVFHVAANTSHWRHDEAEQWDDNVLGTRNVAQAAVAKRAKRFVFTSTGAADTSSLNPYARSKGFAEREVAASGIDAVILRPAIVIGAYDYNSYSQIFTAMQRGRRLVLPGAIEFCHAKDVAKAHIRAYEVGHGTYTLGGQMHTWLRVFRKIARLVGVKPPERETPLWALYAIAGAAECSAYLTGRKPLLTADLVRLLAAGGSTPADDAAKAKRDLGYESAPLDCMLRDCYQWLLGEGRVHAAV